MSDTRLVGVALLLVVPFLLATGVVSVRGGYASSSFWRSDRDTKLELIARRSDDWLMLHVIWVALLVVFAGGMTGACFVVARAGEEALAGIGLGVFLMSLVCWLLGVLLQGPPAALAARMRSEQGSTPHWLEPLFAAVGWAEATYVAGTSASYVILGTAIVATGVPATWAGWASIVVGVLGILGMLVAREWVTFPELPLVGPIVLGVAFLLA